MKDGYLLYVVLVLLCAVSLGLYIISIAFKNRMMYYSSNKYEKKMMEHPLYTSFRLAEITQDDIEFIHLTYTRCNSYVAYIPTAIIILTVLLQIELKAGLFVAIICYLLSAVIANRISFNKIAKHYQQIRTDKMS